MSEVNIKQASAGDALAIAQIQRRCWDEYLQRRNEGAAERDTELNRAGDECFWKEQILLGGGNEWRVFCAERDGSIIGFIAVTISARDNSAYIQALHVSSEYRRQAVGNELLAHALNYLRDLGFEKLFVWLSPGDTTLIPFIESWRFKLDGAYRKYPERSKEIRFLLPVEPW